MGLYFCTFSCQGQAARVGVAAGGLPVPTREGGRQLHAPHQEDLQGPDAVQVRPPFQQRDGRSKNALDILEEYLNSKHTYYVS
jgi:hypothetical protein